MRRIRVFLAMRVLQIAALVVLLHYRTNGAPALIPNVDTSQQYLWSTECVTPDGQGLAIGGLIQWQLGWQGDVRAPTRIRVNGKWEDIRREIGRRNTTWDLNGIVASYYKGKAESRVRNFPATQMARLLLGYEWRAETPYLWFLQCEETPNALRRAAAKTKHLDRRRFELTLAHFEQVAERYQATSTCCHLSNSRGPSGRWTCGSPRA